MLDFPNFNPGTRLFYSNEYYSGDYNHEIYLKKSIDDGSNRPKFYISIFTKDNDIYKLQGYLYFYLDYTKKSSSFIGLKVNEEYRNLNIASLLISLWLDICLNNGYKNIDINHKQRKPFLLYLLKTYGFEVANLKEYYTRDDVITICKNENLTDKAKYLLFKSPKHAHDFQKTNTYKSDNYIIANDGRLNLIYLDKIIFPLQDAKYHPALYSLLNEDLANEKLSRTLSQHHK